MSRVLKALTVYLVVGAGVWFFVEPVRRVFVLPAMFTTATRGLLVAFLPLALITAWRYPHVGQGGAGEDPTE